jgi:hypothetical protein
MSRVATVGSLRSPSIGKKNMPWFVIASAWRTMLSMNDGLQRTRRATQLAAISSSIASEAVT